MGKSLVSCFFLRHSVGWLQLVTARTVVQAVDKPPANAVGMGNIPPPQVGNQWTDFDET